MSSAQTDHSSSVDGRNLRRQRNRQAIVNALLELYEEGRIDVSAALIVQRAGLSERSLFRYFDDLNDLYQTACDTHFERMSKYAVIDAYTRGSLTEKIEHFVEQRAKVFIATRNIAIVARIHSRNIAPVHEQLQRGRALLREQSLVHFQSEFAEMDRTQRLAVSAAVDVLVSFESFELLRHNQGLTVDEIKSILSLSLSKLFSKEYS